MRRLELTVEELLERAKEWNRRGDDMFECQLHNDATLDVYPVSASDLAQVHPLLPGALNALITHYQSIHPNFSAAGLHVKRTLNVLQHGVVEVVNTEGTVCVLSKIHDVLYDATACTEVTLDTDRVYTKKVKVCGEDVYLILSSFNEVVLVNPSELDMQFPGWKEQWEIGVTLGVPCYELQRMVFFDVKKRGTEVPVNTLHFE